MTKMQATAWPLFLTLAALAASPAPAASPAAGLPSPADVARVIDFLNRSRAENGRHSAVKAGAGGLVAQKKLQVGLRSHQVTASDTHQQIDGDLTVTLTVEVETRYTVDLGQIKRDNFRFNERSGRLEIRIPRVELENVCLKHDTEAASTSTTGIRLLMFNRPCESWLREKARARVEQKARQQFESDRPVLQSLARETLREHYQSIVDVAGLKLAVEILD